MLRRATHLKMCLSAEASDIASTLRVKHTADVSAVLRGDGVVTRDVIVVVLVREVQQKVVGAGRDDWINESQKKIKWRN